MNEDELKKILNQIRSVDKTPEYEYFSENNDDTNYLNADGVAPNTGCRWTTPRDICKTWLKDIESGNLKESFKKLMSK